LKTLNILGHKSTEKVSYVPYFSQKKSAQPQNQRNQHCHFKDNTEEFWTNSHTRLSVLLKLMVCLVTAALIYSGIIMTVMKRFRHP
jgi:hypothetical protein